MRLLFSFNDLKSPYGVRRKKKLKTEFKNEMIKCNANHLPKIKFNQRYNK